MSSVIPVATDSEDHRVLPVSLADLKDQLRIEHNDLDRLLLTKIMAATNEAESYLDGPVMARSFELVLNAFPMGSIDFPNPPIRSVTSVQYYDTGGLQQTFSNTSYQLIQSKTYPGIYLLPGAAWPSTQAREDAVTVTYVAGHAAKPSEIPPAICEAIRLRAATRFVLTEEVGTEDVLWTAPDNLGFQSLLSPYRNVTV